MKCQIYVFAFLVIVFSFSCGGKKQNEITTKTRTPEQQKLYDEYSKKFEEDPRAKKEVFRIFASSDFYKMKQMAAAKKIAIKEDEAGNQHFSEALRPFDKIDYASEAIVKVELYPDTGKISRIRFVRPSGIGELDQMISDDITRFQFVFTNKRRIEPRIFTIHYYVLLQNRVTREEALKELKKYAY